MTPMMALAGSFRLHQWHLDQEAERVRIATELSAMLGLPAGYRSRISYQYSLRTLRLINDENMANVAKALYQWDTISNTFADENQTREMILFCLPYSELIGKHMLMFALNKIRASRESFDHIDDLCALEPEESFHFAQILHVTFNVYLRRRTEYWTPMEDMEWRENYFPMVSEAHDAFPTPNSELVDVIVANPGRTDDIITYLIDREVDVSKVDGSMLEIYLDSESHALAEGAL